MKLQFVLAPEDHVAFNMFHFHHSPTMRRNVRNTIVLSWLAVVVLFLWLALSQRDMLLLIVGVILSPLAPVLSAWGMRRQMRGNVENLIAEGKNQGIYGPQELELADGRLISRSEGRMSAVDVRFIERIVRTEDHLYLYVSGLSAHVVPRAFVTDDELDDFLDALNESCPDLTEKPTSSTAITEYVRRKGTDESVARP